MSAAVDYLEHRDAVSGELVPLVPVVERPEHFADLTVSADRFEIQAEHILTVEERFEQYRERKLSAAITVLQDLIREAQHDGIAASKVVDLASADLIIATLCDRLREAKALIPDETARIRIDAAIAAAGHS